MLLSLIPALTISDSAFWGSGQSNLELIRSFLSADPSLFRF